MDASPYITPKKENKKFTWRSTEREVFFSLKDTYKQSESCHCIKKSQDTDLKVRFVRTPVMWRAAEDRETGLRYYFRPDDQVRILPKIIVRFECLRRILNTHTHVYIIDEK